MIKPSTVHNEIISLIGWNCDNLTTYILNNVRVFLRIPKRPINAGNDEVIRTAIRKVNIRAALLSSNKGCCKVKHFHSVHKKLGRRLWVRRDLQFKAFESGVTQGNRHVPNREYLNHKILIRVVNDDFRTISNIHEKYERKPTLPNN